MDQENDKTGWFRRLKGLKEKILNRDFAVFTFFLFLSAFLWYLNALSKDMTGRLVFPARYVSMSDNRALVNELPDKLTLTVSGPGYSILKNRLRANKPPLPVDLGRVNHKVTRDDSRYEFYILTYALREDFSKKLRDEFEIMTIDPDTIYFEFDRVAKKTVPVRPVVDVTTMKQYMVYGQIICTPDSVEISGPRTMIDTINEIRTRPEKVTGVNTTVYLNPGVETIKKVNISHKKIEITIPVEQFTEAVKEVPVTLLNVPDSGTIRLFPDKVKVYCNVAMKDYNALLASPVEAISDLRGVDIRVTEKLNITLRNVPSYATMVRHNPTEIEYIFEKK